MKVTFFARLLIQAFIPALLCCTAFEAAAAQQQDTIPSYRFRLLGVYDERSGDPVADVKVSDMLSGTFSLTSSTGTVSLMFLPEGGSLVSIKKVGYEPQTLPVPISPSDTLPITLLMRPLTTGQITQLPAIRTIGTAPYISGALRAFQEREKEGFGYFIDDTTLRKNEGHQLADVIRPRAPGADFFYGPHGAQYVGAMRCGGGASTVYLDGVPLSGDPGPMIMVQGKTRITTTPPDLSQIPVEMLGGVEWYPSTNFAPIEFGGTTQGCGVLLLWTRER